MSIPHLFRCPITLDIFTDPVTLSTGQTYDRPAIEKWLSHGNYTCPVTMQRLHDTSFVPNRTLRKLIDQWLLSVPDPDTGLDKPIKLAQPTASGTTCSLASFRRSLESTDTKVSTKLAILKKVRILSTESDIAHACLIQLGYFPLLLQMLFGSLIFIDDNDSEFVEVGLDCVLSLLNPTQLDSLNLIKTESNLASFLLLLHKGNVKIKTSLCYLLGTITTSHSTQELAQLLRKSKLVLPTVISLLHNRTNGQAPDAAVRAISGFSSTEANKTNVVREGGVDGLISYLMNPNCKCSSIALATLDALAGTEYGKKAIIKNQNAVGVLVKSVFKVSSSSDKLLENEGGEYAISVLLMICMESVKLRKEAVNAGVVTQVLMMLQSQCGGRARAKARSLLKLLRSMWGRDPGVGDNFYCVMHVN